MHPKPFLKIVSKDRIIVYRSILYNSGCVSDAFRCLADLKLYPDRTSLISAGGGHRALPTGRYVWRCRTAQVGGIALRLVPFLSTIFL